MNVDGIALRRATVADAPAIQAIFDSDPETYALLEGTPPRPDEALALLAELPPGVGAEHKYVFVAPGLCVIDLVEGFPTATIWYLGLIFVAAGARKHGLGTRLLHGVCAHVRVHGGTALRLAVVVENTAARRLYDRLGFEHVARRQRTTAVGTVQELDVLELAVTA